MEPDVDGGTARGIHLVDAGSSYSTETSVGNTAGDLWLEVSSRSDGILSGVRAWEFRESDSTSVRGFDLWAALYEGSWNALQSGTDGDGQPEAVFWLYSSEKIDRYNGSAVSNTGCLTLDSSTVSYTGSATVAASNWKLCFEAGGAYTLRARVGSPGTITPSIVAGKFTDQWGELNRVSKARAPGTVTWSAP